MDYFNRIYLQTRSNFKYFGLVSELRPSFWAAVFQKASFHNNILKAIVVATGFYPIECGLDKGKSLRGLFCYHRNSCTVSCLVDIV